MQHLELCLLNTGLSSKATDVFVEVEGSPISLAQWTTEECLKQPRGKPISADELDTRLLEELFVANEEEELDQVLEPVHAAVFALKRCNA